MKRMLVGIVLTIVGLVYSAVIFGCSFLASPSSDFLMNLSDYGLGLPFILSFLVMITGLIICIQEGYIYNKEKK